MYSYTAATLAIRAKCSLSSHYLALPNDQPFCCHRPCCHFSVSPRFFSEYLLSLSSSIPSKTLLHVGRRRLRFFYRSRDSDMMGLLAEPEERFTGMGESVRNRGRREYHIKSNEGLCPSSRKEGKTGTCLSRRSDGLSLVRDSKLHCGRRRAGGESPVGYGNRKIFNRYDAVDVAEEEVQEVHKYVDDSRRERRNSSKGDAVLDSSNDESTNRNGSFWGLGVHDVDEKVNPRGNLAQQVNIRKSRLDRRLNKLTRISEVQLDDALDDVKGASVSAEVRKIEKGESSASAAKQNRGMDHRVVGHDQQRRSIEKQSKSADLRYTDAHSAVYPQRDFEEASIRGRGERAYLEQNSAKVSRDKIIQLDGRALEQNESRRSTQMEMELHLSVGNRSEEREDKLIMAGDSIQFSSGERKQIVRGAQEHDETRRKTQMLSEFSEVHGGNVELFSHSREKRGMEFGSYAVRGSSPATNDKGIQVEIPDACYDQIEMSRFNANNVVNSTSLWRSPSVSRVDTQEYDALLASNQVSSIKGPNDQANKQGYVLYDARMKSERDAIEFDFTRSNNTRISNLQETYNSRIENENYFSSTEVSSLVLAQEKEIQRSSLTGESSQSASIEMISTGSLHGEFVSKLQKEVVALNESGKSSNVSAGIQIEKPGWRDVQETLRIENRNETSSTVVTQERKERHSNRLLGESFQHKTMQIASMGSLGDVSNSIKTYSTVNNHSSRNDIYQITNDALESAKRLDKSSSFHLDEFVDVDEIQQEIMSLNESGKEPNVSTSFQIEEFGRRENQAITGMQVGEPTEIRENVDGRHNREGGRTSSGSGMRGPSDEMWGLEISSAQETSNAEEPEENSPTSGSTDLATSTLQTTNTRSPRSLWSYVSDIIRMSWILRGHPRSSTLNSYKKASSNESLSSEAWFSGPEADEDGAGDETQNTEKTGLLKESALMKESVKPPFQESKNEDRLTVLESNSSISSGFMAGGLSSRIASSLVEAERTKDSKSSQGALSSVALVEQQLASKSDAELSSITDVVGSSVRDKVKVLKPSSTYPAAVMRVGFGSSVTQATGADQMEAALVGEDKNSSLEDFAQPLVSTINSALPRITDTEEVDKPGSIPKLELDPLTEKLPEFGGIKEAGIKRRNLQRNKQVLSKQFDEWEEAFKRENEHKKLDEYFMREAILEAKKGADTWEIPVGAVLVQNGKIIARGCNMVEELRDSTAHAEMICIREASSLLRTWRLAETTLYVTLEPCPMCAGAILQARIDTVVWGAPNRLLGADGSWVRLFPGGDGESSGSMNPPSQIVGPVHPFHPKITIRRGVLETECGDVMQQFFKLRRKKDKKPESSPPPSGLPISNRPKFFSRLHNIFCVMFCL